MLELPVFETLLTIFAFGLVICGIVYLGYQDAREAARINRYEKPPEKVTHRLKEELSHEHNYLWSNRRDW